MKREAMRISNVAAFVSYPMLKLLVPRRWSLATRLTFFSVCLLLGVAGIVTAGSLAAVEQERSQAVDEARITAETAGTALGGFMLDVETGTQAMAFSLSHQPGPLDQQTAGPYLAAMAEQFGFLRSIFLTDTRGIVVAGMNDGGVGIDLSQREYTIALQSGKKTYWSGTLAATQTGQPIVAFGRVIADPSSGDPRAFLIAAFYPDQMAARLPPYPRPDTGLLIIDNKGRVLYSARFPSLENDSRDLSSLPEVQQALGGNVVPIRSVDLFSQGDARTGAFAPVSRTGWVVGFTRSQATIIQAIWGRLLLQGSAIMGMMVLAAILFWLLSRRVMAPLSTIARLASAIARGERPEVPLLTETPEVEQLSLAFQTMGKAIQNREDALHASEAELQARGERLQLAMEVGSVGAWEYDVPLDAVTWTPNLEMLFGMAPGSFRGSWAAVLETVYREDRDAFRTAMDEALHRGASFSLEYRGTMADGSLRWFAAKARVQRGISGDPLRVTGTCADITERKRAELDARFLAEATTLLNASLDQNQVLRDVANLVVSYLADWCTIDVEEDGELKRVAVVHKDPARVEQALRWQEMFKFNPNASRGVATVLRTGEPEFYRSITDQMIEEAGLSPEQSKIIQALGLRSAVTVPLTTRERTFGAITMVTADSARVYTNLDFETAKILGRRISLAIENARLYAELQKAVQVKDEFLGVISHELRTPITSIYGAARLLVSRGKQLDEQTKESLFSDIETETQRMAQLVEDLLYLARLELGATVATEPVSVARVVEKVRAVFSRTRPARSVELDLETDLPPATGDASYVEQVLRNLLSNADKYSPSESPIQIKAQHKGNEVIVSVLDRGYGLSPGEEELIFDRFYRSQSTAHKARGLGIGLTVCKRLVEAQGGRIWAQSREGGGLEIGFSLSSERDHIYDV